MFSELLILKCKARLFLHAKNSTKYTAYSGLLTDIPPSQTSRQN